MTSVSNISEETDEAEETMPRWTSGSKSSHFQCEYHRFESDTGYK